MSTLSTFTQPISPARLAANRQNAQHSTGPRTESGKTRSRLNSFKHGLTGRTVLLPNEDPTAYKKFSDSLLAHLAPATPWETELAQTIADSRWRLHRVRSIEDGMLASGHFESHGDFDAQHPDIHAAITASRVFRDHSQSFVNITLYEQRLHKAISTAMTELKELQAERLRQREDDLSRASEFRQLNEMQNLPWQPATDGFVFSTSDIDAFEHRESRDYLRNIARRAGFDLTTFKQKTGL